MSDVLRLASENLLSPVVLFFALGFAAGRLRSDLSIPEPISKGLTLYLMVAIGFKGGWELAGVGLSGGVVATLLAAAALSLLLPVLAFFLVRLGTRTSALDSAAIAAHYGSVSVVTFVAATAFLVGRGVPFEGHLVAAMVVMEAPAILAGLWLARRFALGPSRRLPTRVLLREVVLSGSVILLLGSFGIAWITGDDGRRALAPVLEAPFQGVLCFFLLDLGLVAARRLAQSRRFDGRLVAFGLVMPPLAAGIGLLVAAALGLSVGGATLLAVLSASASYIVVPAALRLALPEANPGLSLPLSLGVTFPFNLVVGIPLYHGLARLLLG